MEGWTFLHSGNPTGQQQHGVALALSPRAAAALLSWEAVSERLLHARLRTASGKVSVIVAYAPAQNSRRSAEATQAARDAFYAELQAVVSAVNAGDRLLVLGDFNAQVGGATGSQHPSTGTRGLRPRICDGGERLLAFCAANDLIITGTLFDHADIHKRT